MENLIINVVGSHSTGKTTILDYMQNEFEGYFKKTCNLVPSVSRTKLNTAGLKLYGDTDDFVQAWLSLLNWGNILKSAREFDVTLCTDLGIRSLAYTLASPSVTNNSTLKSHEDWIDSFYSKDLFNVEILTIYLPIDFDMVKDGIRLEDDEYRVKVDEFTKRILDYHKIPHYRLLGTEKDREKAAFELMAGVVKYKPTELVPFFKSSFLSFMQH